MAMPTDIEIVDLGLGFPHTSIEEKKAAYDSFRADLKDAESEPRWSSRAVHLQGRARHRAPKHRRREWVVEKMDAFDIRIARVGLSERGIEARRRYPDRFVIGMSVGPNDVMGPSAGSRRRRRSTASSRRWCSPRATCRRSRSTAR